VKRIATSLSVLFLSSLMLFNAEASQGTAVTSGALTFASHAGAIEVSGQSGFSLQARVSGASGIFAAENQCAELDCQPGTQVSLFAHWSGNDLPGSATLRGQPYVLGSEGAGGAMGVVTFDGSVTLPDFTSSAAVDVSAPFTFSGQLAPEGSSDVEALHGAGTATLHFAQSADGSAWQFAGAAYQFHRHGASTKQD
jgi:hypothetical protein